MADSELKKTIRALNKLGAVDYTPDTVLTKWQKYNLKKKTIEFRQVLKNPDEFKVARVSKNTARALLKSGFQVTKTLKAVIPKKGFDTVKIDGSELLYTGTNKKTGKKITELVTLIGDTRGFEAQINRLRKVKLKKNQTLSVKIGDNATMARHFTTLAELENYINKVSFRLSPGQTREDILKIISIVTVEGGTTYAKIPKKKHAHPKGK